MIASFRHKGLRDYWQKGSKAGIDAKHAPRLATLLTALDAASKPGDMGLAGYGLHPLSGKLAGYWAVSVSGNWRLTFRFDENGNACEVDYLDYH